jgi:bacterioferritin
MTAKRSLQAGILADRNAAKREEIVSLLTTAYWMEIETVMSYIANAANLDGIRADEIAEALEKDTLEELGHAQQFAARIKELDGVVPGSLEFRGEQDFLQPPADPTEVVQVIDGVIAAEAGAIEHYNRIVEACDGVDWVTMDLVIEILRDEEGHLRRFERFRTEYVRESSEAARQEQPAS